MALAACVAALAQTSTYNLGRAPSEEELRAMSISIGPDGKGLPPGSGTAKEGAKIFAQKCARCHGAKATTGAFAFEEDTPEDIRYRPFATSIWDAINRKMPPSVQDTRRPGLPALPDPNNIAGVARPGTLSADEVYALTAFLLNTRGIVQENDVIDAKSLPKIRMPTTKQFIPADLTDWKPGLFPEHMRHIDTPRR